MNRNLFSSFVIFFFSISSYAQEGVKTTAPTSSVSKVTGKIMLIPYESKLYMSSIDQSINKVTNWNFNQIRENFRKQLDAQLTMKMQSYGGAVSFYADSAKMSKDLDYIYKSTSLSYDLVEKPSNPTIATTDKTKNIKNGQLAVELNSDKKFMNTKIVNIEMLDYLNKKYKSEYFVFINELDINTDADSYDVKTDSYQRSATVHYTIIDKTGKLITAGAAVSNFSSKINEPKKIVSQSFAPIASFIATKYDSKVNVK